MGHTTMALSKSAEQVAPTNEEMAPAPLPESPGTALTTALIARGTVGTPWHGAGWHRGATRGSATPRHRAGLSRRFPKPRVTAWLDERTRDHARTSRLRRVYDTLLVDLNQSVPVDLLPDRCATSVGRWLVAIARRLFALGAAGVRASDLVATLPCSRATMQEEERSRLLPAGVKPSHRWMAPASTRDGNRRRQLRLIDGRGERRCPAPPIMEPKF